MISQTAEHPGLKAENELTEFASFLAHEVRGPLTVILGNARLLQRSRSFDKLAGDGLDDILHAADKLSRITDGLLHWVHGAQEYGPVAITPVVGKVVELFRKQQPSRTVRLSLQDDLLAFGEQTFAEDIIENLMTNAHKYSPSDQSIDVEVYGQGGLAVICVADRGKGITEVDQQRIFDLFARLAPGGAIPGCGIGLSLCKRLAESMDGELRFNNRPGGGSCFSLVLRTY